MIRRIVFAIIVATGALTVSASASRAVTISELNVEISAEPGQAYQRNVELYDETLSGATVYPVVLNFREDPDREGSAVVLTDPADLKPDREWVKFDTDRVELPADGSFVSFPYRIEVPEKAEPGTHLLSLVFKLQPPSAEGDTTVAIGSNVAANLFLKVAGATKDAISLTLKAGRFGTDDPTLTPAERAKTFEERTFFTRPPVEFLVKVANTGNTHQKPDGNIKIYNDLFGGGVVDQMAVNRDNRIILPGSDRTFGVESFGEGLMIGKYRAKITMIYGSPLRDTSAVVTFWIVPVRELSAVLAVLILLILLVILLRRQQRRRQRTERERLKREIEAEMQTRTPSAPERQIPVNGGPTPPPKQPKGKSQPRQAAKPPSTGSRRPPRTTPPGKDKPAGAT